MVVIVIIILKIEPMVTNQTAITINHEIRIITMGIKGLGVIRVGVIPHKGLQITIIHRLIKGNPSRINIQIMGPNLIERLML